MPLLLYLAVKQLIFLRFMQKVGHAHFVRKDVGIFRVAKSARVRIIRNFFLILQKQKLSQWN